MMFAALWFAGSSAVAQVATAEPFVISNEHLSVGCDSAGRLSFRARGGPDSFLASEAPLLEARLAGAEHPVLGAGEALVLRREGGRTDTIALHPGLAFALVTTSIANEGTEPLVLHDVAALGGALELGVPVDALRALGTGGLHGVADSPGSYMWLAVADPLSRAGIVAGWLTSERGSGIVSVAREGESVRLGARLDYGMLRIEPGETATLETLAVGRFADARLGLEQYADAVARVQRIHLPPQPAGYCTWYHAGPSNESQLAEQARFASEELAPYGFGVVQIDDGWQAGQSANGPRKVFGTHDPTGPYPSGMEQTARRVSSLGLTPGLWLMPFAGTFDDPFFADKQQWFVHRADGTPYDTQWGGTCLDLTLPTVRDYLTANIARATREWGYRYLKMDGMWTGTGTPLRYVNEGYVDDGIGDAVFHDPAVTNVEAYRGGLRLVREAAGPEVFLLGCCAPQNMRSYGGAFGLVDAMRIGPDSGPDWGGLITGPRFGSRHWFLHGRVWYNDPDPIYVRPEVPLEQARLLCSWVTVAGQLSLSSEWYPGLPAERLDLLRRTLPSHRLLARPVDVFEEPIPTVWLLTDDRGAAARHIVGLFNWSDDPRTFDLPLERVGLDPALAYGAFDYWADRLLPTIRERLTLTVPPRSCVVLALRPFDDEPVLLSTSRHITQGIVDVTDERWDRATGTLAATSRVVGGEPYELRIAVPRGWAVGQASASIEGGGTIPVEVREEPGLVRATIRPEQPGTLDWQIAFRLVGGRGDA